MTKSKAIRHRALRCRPGNSDRYIAKHDALLAETRVNMVEGGVDIWFQTRGKRRSLWRIIKGWFA